MSLPAAKNPTRASPAIAEASCATERPGEKEKKELSEVAGANRT
jgi:hypothetical protein